MLAITSRYGFRHADMSNFAILIVYVDNATFGDAPGNRDPKEAKMLGKARLEELLDLSVHRFGYRDAQLADDGDLCCCCSCSCCGGEWKII
jgi:hypothetical protein